MSEQREPIILGTAHRSATKMGISHRRCELSSRHNLLWACGPGRQPGDYEHQMQLL